MAVTTTSPSSVVSSENAQLGSRKTKTRQNNQNFFIRLPPPSVFFEEGSLGGGLLPEGKRSNQPFSETEQLAPKLRFLYARVSGRSPGFRIILLAAPSQGLRPFKGLQPQWLVAYGGHEPLALRLWPFATIGLAAFVPGYGCGPAPDLHRTSRLSPYLGHPKPSFKKNCLAF